MSKHDWVVYEHSTGTVWTCEPATPTNAKREVALAGAGHTAMRRDAAERLRNAWAFGRVYGARTREPEVWCYCDEYPGPEPASWIFPDAEHADTCGFDLRPQPDVEGSDRG